MMRLHGESHNNVLVCLGISAKVRSCRPGGIHDFGRMRK